MSKNLLGIEQPKKVKINTQDISERLFDFFQGLSLDEFISLITNELTEIIEYVELSSGDNKCQKTSLLFNPHRLDTKTKNSKQSIYSALRQQNFINGLTRALEFKHGKVKELLYQTIQLGINGVQYVNEFPPAKARDLCEYYRVPKNGHVLDPCGGWGGRMIGTSVVCNSYHCYEPSTMTASGLNKLKEWINLINKDFKAEIFCLPYEDSEVRENFYDFAFTSPPYYDTEEYSQEETNSFNRYKSFEEWCNKFFFVLIEKTIKSLKNGRPFILNIGSRQYPLNEKLLEYASQKNIEVEKIDFKLGGTAGLGKSGEGETFYKLVF